MCRKNKIKKNKKTLNGVNKTNLDSFLNRATKKKKEPWILWPIKILVITIFLSLGFSTLSEFILLDAGIIVSLIIIFFLLIVGIVSDVIGVATAACPIESFMAMKSRGVKGAVGAIYLIRNAEKISSICNDVIGDICGILSGAAGSVIALKFISESTSNSGAILIAASVSALIAGLMIFGKAVCKRYAIDNCAKVVLATSKAFTFTKFKKFKNN